MTDGPTLVVASVQAVYWTTVAALALSRRLSGRRAGLVPESRGERGLWLGFVPAVGTLVAAPALAALGRWTGPLVVPGTVLDAPPVLFLRWAASGLAVAALAATFRCWGQLGAAWSLATLEGEPSRIVTEGPYAKVRHPIYALGSALAVLTAVAVPSLILVLAAAVQVALLRRKGRLEEEALRRRHQEVWDAYLARTGFFCPRMVGTRPGGR